MDRFTMRIAAALCGLLLVACSQEAKQRMSPGTGQRQEQREQNRAERQTSRQQQQASGAREDLAEQRRDVAQHPSGQEASEAVEARQELQQQSRELTEAANKACAGLSEQEQRACPVQSQSVASVEDIRNGVKVHLASNAGDAEAVERRITCHNARRELMRDQAMTAGRPAEMQTTCFLDVSGVDTDVDDDRGRVSVSVTSRDDANRDRVRELAHRGTEAAPPLRTTGGPLRSNP